LITLTYSYLLSKKNEVEDTTFLPEEL